jgi:hypothetical protein
MTAARLALAAAVLALCGCTVLAHRRSARAFGYALAAQEAGDWEEAARYAEEAQAALPDEETTSSWALDVLGERGRIAVRAGLDEDAERYFTELRDRIDGRWPGSPALAYSLCELAKLYARRGDSLGARALWERVLGFDVDGEPAGDEYRTLAHAGLARLARDAGDGAEADRLFRLAIVQGNVRDDLVDEIRGEYGALLRELGRPGDAERIEAGIGAPPSPRHYLWYVASWRSSLDAFDERMVRRWPDEKMPLRFYLPDPPPGAFPGHDAATVRAAVVEAVEAWRDVVRPGVPSFVFVDSPRGADVRFGWTEQTGDLLGQTRAPRTVAFHPGTIRIATRWNPRVVAPLSGVRSVVMHEVGHALGLWGHSPDPNDLMYPNNLPAIERGAAKLSERDRETLRRLYGLPPGATILRTDVR